MESESAGPIDSASVWSTAARALRSQRESPRIARSEHEGPALLTDGQAMYLATSPNLEQARARTSFVLLEGDLDAHRLERALTEVVRVQHALRTTFFVALDGEPMQALQPPPDPSLNIVQDQNGASPAEIERGICQLQHCNVNLRDGPVYGAALARVSDSRHLLMLGFHHVCWDGWSSNIFFRELSAAYETQASLPEPVVQLADIALWQRQDAYREVTERHLDYWRTALTGLKEAPRLFRDRPLSPEEAPAPTWVVKDLDPEVVDGLRDYRSSSGATLFILALACCYVVCWRYTGVTDLCFESKMANRTRQETRRLIGPLHGHSLVRADLSRDPTFRALVDQVSRSFNCALGASDINIQRLIEALVAEGRIEMPVERIAVDWLTGYDELPALGPVTASRFAGHQAMQAPPKLSELMDVQLRFVESRDRVTMHLLRNSDYVTSEEAADFMHQFGQVAATVLDSPDRPLGELPGGGSAS